MKSDVPPIPLAIVEYLEKAYPVRLPALDEPERKIFYRTGQVDVVRHLRDLHTKQTKQKREQRP